MPVETRIRRTRKRIGKKNLIPAEKILIGVELEFSHPNYDGGSSDADIRSNLNAKAEAAINILEIDVDASGRDGGGVEIATEPYNFDWWTKNGHSLFTKIMKVFTDLSYTADNNYAGMHIHIDRNVFTFNQFKEFVQFVNESRSFLLPFSRRKRRTSFINPLTNEGKNGQNYDMENNSQALEAIFKDSRRYYGNNCIVLNNHGEVGTIECRFFNGTLSPDIAMANVEFIRCLCYFIKSSRSKTITIFLEYAIDYGYKYPHLVSYLKSINLLA